MHWQRVALEERLTILREQFDEQKCRPDGTIAEWLHHQVDTLLAAAESAGEIDYIRREVGMILPLAD